MTDHIEFKPTPKDIGEAALAIRPKNWGRYERLRIVLGGAFISLSIFMAVAAFVWRRHGIFLLAWEDLLAFAFAGAVLGWFYGRLLTHRSDDDPRLMPRTFTLSKDGFETTGPGFETKVDWTAVAEIAQRGPTIVFIPEWKEAFFVPRSAFASLEEADRFVQRARDLWSARWDEFTTGPGEANPAAKSYDVVWRMERSDLAAFANLKREITGWRKAFIFLPPVLAGGLLAWLRDENPAVGAFVDRNNGAAIAIVVVFVAFLYLVILFVRRVLRARRVRRLPLPTTKTALVADAAGVAVTADGATKRHAWTDFPAINLGANHVFLMTALDRAIIVPRRAFRNRPSMLDFFNFAEEASKNAEA